MEPLAQARAPGVGQVREARPELVGVRADQRVPAGQVDVVAHDHQRARARTSGRGRRPHWSGRRPARRGAWNSRTGWTTRPGSLPSYRWNRPWSMTTGRPAERAQQQPADVARAPSRPASRAARRTGSRRRRRGRRPGRRDRTRARSPTSGTSVVRARTAASSAARRAGWSAGGMGRVGSRSTGSASGRSGMRGLQHARPGGQTAEARGFVGPTEVSTPGCRSRPVGRVPRRAAVVRRPPERGQRSARSDRRRSEGP